MTDRTTPTGAAQRGPSLAAGDQHVRCACCGADVPRAESKACASCGQAVCPACTRWYGHFMLVCDDCRIATW